MNDVHIVTEPTSESSCWRGGTLTRDVSHPEMLPYIASAAAGSATHASTAAWSAARPPKAPAGSTLAAASAPTKRSRRTRPVPWTGITARGSTAEGFCGEVIPWPKRSLRAGGSASGE